MTDSISPPTASLHLAPVPDDAPVELAAAPVRRACWDCGGDGDCSHCSGDGDCARCGGNGEEPQIGDHYNHHASTRTA